ncbi:MAG TPA: hypothetical protein VEL28_16300 [Candidatus Binatia bacterium]|nr:hypothetical protein [Candidatus Binatia bacterium]
MNPLLVFVTSFLACCCAIVTVPLAGWYLLGHRAEQCVLEKVEPASELDSVSAQLVAVRVEAECGVARDARHFRSFLQSVTLLDCPGAGWYAVTTAAGQETPKVSPMSRSMWLTYSLLAGTDCW